MHMDVISGVKQDFPGLGGSHLNMGGVVCSQSAQEHPLHKPGLCFYVEATEWEPLARVYGVTRCVHLKRNSNRIEETWTIRVVIGRLSLYC